MRFLYLFLFLIFSLQIQADDADQTKKGIIGKTTSKVSSFLESIIGGDGQGETQVKIATGEDYHPEFSIATVRPLSPHPGVDAWFVQLQLNDHKVRGKARISTNVGLGYRQLSDDKRSLTGANVFIDYDAEGNARSSIGLELKSSSFEVLGNYYRALSGSRGVGDYTERSLDGIELSLVGQVPYLPWANVVANHYEWKKNKNSKDSKGDKVSLELTLTPSLVVDLGVDDNNIDGTNSFANFMFVFPPREKVAASTNFVADTAFSDGDMTTELLSLVRRTNKQAIESEGTGVVIGRLSE
mgnify:FL=1